jgi:chromosome segregation ATPase
MATNPDSAPKDDLLNQIWSVCTTLTEEAAAVASKKAKEAGFDVNRGFVPLPESLINLSSSRSVLEDAIEKQKLVQLPITVQREVLANLQNISKTLLALAGGADEIVNLTNAVETLNTSIWKYGLHNLSDQVLGYQKKLNQLKNQELQISKVLAQLEVAKTVAADVTQAAAETEQRKTDSAALLDQIKQTEASSASLLGQITEAGTKSAALFATIQQNEKQGGELTASIRTANNELLALDGSIRKFYGEVDEYRKKIAQTGDDASELITNSETAIKQLTDDTNAKVEEAVEASKTSVRTAVEELTAKASEALDTLQTNSKSTIDELTKRLEEKLAQDDVSFSELTSTTKANITTFQTGVEGQMATAIEDLGESSSKLVSDARGKLAELEEQLGKRSEETIDANKKKTDELLEELTKLKEEVRAQIQQATGFALFGAFQARQNKVVESKQFWAWAIAALVALSIMVTTWIAYEAKFYSAHDFAFWVKLSLTIPIGYAIAFCTVQYGRERRLEEEYAFKASISVSLNPYRELIHSILQNDAAKDQTKYADFVIESVKGVFMSPTDKVFEGEKKEGIGYKALKQATELAGIAAKSAK